METWSDELVLQMIHDQRTIVDYFYVSLTALFVYDHLITFRLEVSLVWYQSRWTYTKILFIMARYLPYPGVFLFLYDQVFRDVSSATCRWAFVIAALFSVLGVMSAEAIFMIRTWALWQRHRGIGFLFISLILIVTAVEIFSVIKYINGMAVSSPPFKGFTGCLITGMNTVSYIAFYCLFGLDLVILVLTVMSAYMSRFPQIVETAGDGRSVSSIVHQDGILLYLYILCLTIACANIVGYGPETLVNVVYLVPVVTYSILSTRAILNIRSMSEREYGTSDATELHTVNHRQDTHIPLAFRNPDASRNSVSDIEWVDRPAGM